jgi:hypothetical protein
MAAADEEGATVSREDLPFLETASPRHQQQQQQQQQQDGQIRSGAHWASSGGRRACIEALLQRLADPDVVLNLAFGQLLAVLICATGIFSKRLAKVGLSAPTTQSLTNYLLLGVVWSTVLRLKQHWPDRRRSSVPRSDADDGGGDAVDREEVDLTARERRRSALDRCLITLADVEANYLAVKAYSLTTFTSVQLLDCASLPAAIAFSALLLGRRYRAQHFGGAALSAMGLVFLVFSDASGTISDAVAPHPVAGDMLCVLAGGLCAPPSLAASPPSAVSCAARSLPLITDPRGVLDWVGVAARRRPAGRRHVTHASDAASNVGAETVLVGGRRGGVRRERLGQAAWLARLGWGGALISFVQILLVERGEVRAPSDPLASHPGHPLLRPERPRGQGSGALLLLLLLLLLRVHRHV